MYISYYRQQCPANSIPYTVREGDTLYKIAELFSSNVQRIMEANPEINPNLIMIGQQLCIPQTPNIFPACPTTNYYVVKKEDTFFTIAQYFEVPYYTLVQANLGVAPEDLYEDMFICIPVAPSPVNIEINTAIRKLLLYHHGKLLRTYDIAVGKESTPTLTGEFTIANKQVEPGGVYGSRRMGFSTGTLGIHGTSSPGIIGTASTDGSIAMNNGDINELFNFTPVGTEVKIF
jgi:L,D-transpeptidase ErfK/SrfK